MGGKPSKKKLVPNRPPPKTPAMGPLPTRMVAKTKRNLVPPDGGWGWMVVLGACITVFFFPAVTMAFGVLFSEKLEIMGAGATAFTLIGNGLSTSWSFTALLTAPLLELFGYRTITITGGLMSFLTMVLCAYSTSIVSFALSYSIVGGMSCSFSTFVGMVIITKYFNHRKGLANGMVSSAASLGKIGTAPLVRLLLDNYGYTWSCLLVGALSLHTCIAGMLYQPPEWHLIPEPRDPEDDDVRLEDVPAPITSVAITDNGLVEQNGNPPASGAPAKTTTDDDDDDIIFVMPTTPTTVNPPGKDDEVILFSRVKDLREKTNIEDNKLPLALRDSKWSLSGSIPLLPVGDQKLFCSDDDDDQDDCCNDCLVVKVFRMLNYSLLKQPHFHLVAWANALSLLGYINTLYALPGYVSSLGYTPYQSAFAISSFSATEAVFRLIFAGLSDYSWFPIELVYTIGFTLSALFCGLLPVSSSYNWVMLCVAVNGISNSVSVVLFIHMIIKYLGVDQYSQVFSFVFMFNGAVIVVGGFLLGLVRDYFESYIATFLCISALYSTAAAIWWSRRCLKIIKNRYKKVPVHTQ